MSVALGDHTLILDAGTGIRRLGRILQAEARGNPIEVDLLITHTHWDHIQGFPFFVPAYVPGNRVRVYGPRSASKPLDAVLRGQMDPEYFPVALGDMAADVTVQDVRDGLRIGPFWVEVLPLNHPGVTVGYRIEAAGRSIAYLTDTEPFFGIERQRSGEEGEPDSNLVQFARGVDLYIADSQYLPEEYAQKVGWGHSDCTDAVALAIAAGARRLALFSHDPMHDDETVDAKVALCRDLALDQGAALEVVGASEGQTILLRGG